VACGGAGKDEDSLGAESIAAVSAAASVGAGEGPAQREAAEEGGDGGSAASGEVGLEIRASMEVWTRDARSGAAVDDGCEDAAAAAVPGSELCSEADQESVDFELDLPEGSGTGGSCQEAVQAAPFEDANQEFVDLDLDADRDLELLASEDLLADSDADGGAGGLQAGSQAGGDADGASQGSCPSGGNEAERGAEPEPGEEEVVEEEVASEEGAGAAEAQLPRGESLVLHGSPGGAPLALAHGGSDVVACASPSHARQPEGASPRKGLSTVGCRCEGASQLPAA
jgi:hypothetical protein